MDDRHDSRPNGQSERMDEQPPRRRFSKLALAGSSLLLGAGALPGCAGMRGLGGMGGPPAGADWLEIVKFEHRAVDAAFGKLMATTDRDVEQRAELRDLIANLLTNHAVEEENVLYPALAMAGQRPESAELYREHAEVKVMLSELEIMPKNHPGWLDRARQLQQAVRQHVQVEETRLYPAMRARMSADQNAMVTQMYVREGKKYDGA